MNRRERLEALGDRMKRFNNVYVKNFTEEMSDEKLNELFDPYGKIISAKVKLSTNTSVYCLNQTCSLCLEKGHSLD